MPIRRCGRNSYKRKEKVRERSTLKDGWAKVTVNIMKSQGRIDHT